jgi:hypothetical protein
MPKAALNTHNPHLKYILIISSRYLIILGYDVLRHFQQYFSYVVAVSFPLFLLMFFLTDLQNKLILHSFITTRLNATFEDEIVLILKITAN